MTIMMYLQKLDVFKREPSLTIKRMDSVSIIETIVFSMIFYCLAFSIIMYNFLDVYLQNKPIVQQSEEIRDLNSFEIIETSKLKLGITPNNARLSFDKASLEILHLKDPRILNIPLYNLNGNAELAFIPTFYAKQTLNSKIMNGCSYLKDSENIISKNVICTEYFDKNTTIGGSPFSGGKSLSQLMELSIDFCNFFNLLDLSFDPKIIENYIKNDLSQLEFFEYIQKGDFSYPPKNSPLANDMFLNNYTNFVNFYSGENTNFQLEDKDYISCDRNERKYQRFNLGILTSTDLLDPLRKEGYYEFLQSKRYEYNPYKNELYINIILTKVILKTDRSLFIGFGRVQTQIIYEQEIQFVEKPKILENNKLEVKIEYILNDRVKNVTRSYNKIDQILA